MKHIYIKGINELPEGLQELLKQSIPQEKEEKEDKSREMHLREMIFALLENEMEEPVPSIKQDPFEELEKQLRENSLDEKEELFETISMLEDRVTGQIDELGETLKQLNNLYKMDEDNVYDFDLCESLKLLKKIDKNLVYAMFTKDEQKYY